jgi:hypothetical protein
MASMAMRMNFGLATSVVGSVQRRFTNESETNMFSQELEKMRKRSRFKLYQVG